MSDESPLAPFVYEGLDPVPEPLGMPLSSMAFHPGVPCVVGGLAGHMAGHGKVGAAAGSAIGHHEANKSDVQKAGASSGAPTRPGLDVREGCENDRGRRN